MPRGMRIANTVMLVLFAAWAGYQHNDPDVLVWLALYGAAAVQCILFFLGRFPRPLALAYIILCTLWAAYLAVTVATSTPLTFGEEGLEMLGLVVCAGWTYVLYRTTRPRPERKTNPRYQKEST